MTKADVDLFFAEFVTWMKTDISREIEWARAGKPAGNLLCALGLVAYTEALGALKHWNRNRFYGTPEICFNAFFDEMDGGTYKRWRTAWEARRPETTIYEALRCGLVHEYRPKVRSAFYFSFDHPVGIEEINGTLVFHIEPFFRHFSAAADGLRDELSLMPNAEVPPAKTKRGWTGPAASVTPSS